MVYRLLFGIGKKVIKKMADKKKARESFKKADSELEEKLFNKDGSFKVDPVKTLDKQITKDKERIKGMKDFYSEEIKEEFQKRTLNAQGGLIKNAKGGLIKFGKPKIAKKGWR